MYSVSVFCVPYTSFVILSDWELNPNWDFWLIIYSLCLFLVIDLRIRLIAAWNWGSRRFTKGDLEMRRPAVLDDNLFRLHLGPRKCECELYLQVQIPRSELANGLTVHRKRFTDTANPYIPGNYGIKTIYMGKHIIVGLGFERLAITRELATAPFATGFYFKLAAYRSKLSSYLKTSNKVQKNLFA